MYIDSYRTAQGMETQLAIHIANRLTGIVTDSFTRRDHVYTSTRHAGAVI